MPHYWLFARLATKQRDIKKMKNEAWEAEKAELIQSIKALYIPFSLFIACVILAGGVFLVNQNEPIGWGFLLVAATIALSAFIALFRFQNKQRAKGIIPIEPDEFDDCVSE